MYYVAIYNNERKRWELSWEGDKAHEYVYLGDALQGYATAGKFEGIQNVMLLRSVSVLNKMTSTIVNPEAYNLPTDEPYEVTI